jgi:hypothetical protein
VRQGGIYGLQHDLLLLACRLSSPPHLVLKVGVVEVSAFGSEFLEALDVFLIEDAGESLGLHFQEDGPLFGDVLGFEVEVLHHFLVAEEVEPFEDAILVVAVVDCADLPATVGHRPFVVFSHVDVVFFLDAALEDEVEGLFVVACFLDHLIFEVALNVETLVELLCFFVLDVQFGEKGTFHHIVDLIPFFQLYLALDSFVYLTP